MLDGVLIGAGDQRYLAWAMVVASFGVFAPLAVRRDRSTAAGCSPSGATIAAWMLARAVGMVGRFVGPRWEHVAA